MCAIRAVNARRRDGALHGKRITKPRFGRLPSRMSRGEQRRPEKDLGYFCENHVVSRDRNGEWLAWKVPSGSRLHITLGTTVLITDSPEPVLVPITRMLRWLIVTPTIILGNDRMIDILVQSRLPSFPRYYVRRRCEVVDFKRCHEVMGRGSGFVWSPLRGGEYDPITRLQRTANICPTNTPCDPAAQVLRCEE